MIKKNLSTPEGRAIWEAVDRAADAAPEWAKKHIEELVRKHVEEVMRKRRVALTVGTRS